MTIYRLFYVAARVGDLEALKAIYYSHADIMKKIWVGRFRTYAIQSGKLGNHEWLRTIIKCSWYPVGLENFINSDNSVNLPLVCMKCPWDASTFTQAVATGNLSVLQWLYDEKCPWIPYTFTAAVRTGNLEVLQWLHEKGCPWDKWTFLVAAQSGNMQIVQWLLEKGCPYDPETYKELTKKLS